MQPLAQFAVLSLSLPPFSLHTFSLLLQLCFGCATIELIPFFGRTGYRTLSCAISCNPFRTQMQSGSCFCAVPANAAPNHRLPT
ncbi:hypothetical protein F5H01DRAFT_334838 [Linnemannia elongata]|nr:hypothetical protein F5H01DRAFT_334838 [Linnemannia elongata]